MNERIQKLAEQAREYATTRHQVSNIVLSINNDKFEQKFAELIVKECAQVAFEGDLKRAIGQWGSHSDILIHFGIEHDVVKKFRGEE